MWKSSRKIALTGTMVVLTAGGLIGLGWMSDFLPVRFGDAPSGEVISEVGIDDINWSSFEPGQSAAVPQSEESPWADQELPPDDIFAGQNEPSPASTGDSREFVSRAGWRTGANGDPNRTPGFASEPEIQSADVSIPEQFPAIEQQRPAGAVSGTIAQEGRLNLSTQPHQVIQQSSYETEPRGSQPGSSTAAGNDPSASRLFTTDPGTLSQARQFPDSVEPVGRGRVSPFEDPNVSRTAESGPPQTPRTASAPGSPVTASPAADSVETVPVTGTEPDLRPIDDLLQKGDYVSAHRDLSKIYWNQPESRRIIQERLDRNARLIYFSPQPHFLEPCIIQPGDYLQRIAPRYRISWQYLASMNGISPRRIRAGQKLKVIKGPFSAFVDLSDFELTVHCHGFYVKRYQIGIGKDGASPIGRFSVLNKVEKPQWTDPDGRVVPADDPTNPLGTHWIDIGDSFGIHGTIDPASIGKAESRGCIRMRNSDVNEVYNLLITGSEVVIRP